MIKIRRNCKEIEGRSVGAIKSVKTGEKQWSARFHSLKEASTKSALCCETISQPQQVRYEIATSLRNRYFAAKSFRSLKPLSAKIFAAAKHPLDTQVPFRSTVTSFRSCETATKSQSVKTPNFATKAPFRRVFRSCEAPLWHMSAILQHSSPHFAAAKQAAKMAFCCENDILLRNWPSSVKIKTTLDIPLFFIKTGHLSCQKVSERKNTKATFCSLSHLSPKPRKPPAITFGHFLQSAMA